MRKFFKDIWIGIKFAFKVPSLPESINKLHNYAITRILRVIGGVSIILFLSSPDWIGDSFIYWTIYIFAMLQFLYILTISVIKIWYIIYLWRNKKLEVRNSPLNQVAYLTVKLATCIKGACVGGAATATVLGLGFGADKLLEEGGYPPIFKKTVGKELGKALSAIGYSPNSELNELKSRMLEVKQRSQTIEELNKVIDFMDNDSSFAGLKDDLKEFKDEFVKEFEKESKMNKINQSKIMSELNRIKKQ